MYDMEFNIKGPSGKKTRTFIKVTARESDLQLRSKQMGKENAAAPATRAHTSPWSPHPGLLRQTSRLSNGLALRHPNKCMFKGTEDMETLCKARGSQVANSIYK